MSTRTLALLTILLSPLPLAAQGTPLTLKDAVTLGRTRGVQGELARLNARAVDRRAARDRGEYLPNINASGAWSRQTNNLTEFGLSIPGMPAVTDPFSIYAVRARATQTIFDGAVINKIHGSGAEASAAGYDAIATADANGLVAGLAWLRAVSAKETVLARQADSTIAADLLRMAREQLQAGISAAIDVTRAEVNVAAIRGQLVAARNAQAQSRLELNRALFFPADTTLVLADSLDASTADLPPRRTPRWPSRWRTVPRPPPSANGSAARRRSGPRSPGRISPRSAPSARSTMSARASTRSTIPTASGCR
jgi:outer membrane protein